MTILEKHRLLHFRAKAAHSMDALQQPAGLAPVTTPDDWSGMGILPTSHWYSGTHNLWTGEVAHDCGCEQFSSEDKAEVLKHIREANEREEANEAK